MSFLRSYQSFGNSRNSQRFTEPIVSLLCPQEPATGHYPEPDEFKWILKGSDDGVSTQDYCGFWTFTSFGSWHPILCQQKCILSLRTALLAY